jgi:hypothetical protein
MSRRAGFAPAILGKVVALGAFVLRARPSPVSQKSPDSPKLPFTKSAGDLPAHRCKVSIHNLPRPGDLPVPDMEVAG